MIEKITLPNGLRLIFEKIPYVRSVTSGIWVGTGSRYEQPDNNGISHFLEHMMFKGSTSRSAMQIAHDMDMLGGQMNAFTSKEYTCFYVKCLDETLYSALDILSDIFLHPRLLELDIENEKRVIGEEISMYLDTPEELVVEKLIEKIWDGSGLDMPILGDEETIANFNRDMLAAYLEHNYCPQNTIISVVGNFDKDELIAYITKVFGGMSGTEPVREHEKAQFQPAQLFLEKDIAQNHLCMAYEGVSREDKMLYAAVIMSNILGDGMGSRLYQTIREQQGLCYTIYSFSMSYLNSGMIGIYAAYNRDTQEKMLSLIKEVIFDFAKNGVTQEEYIRAKQQLKASVIMGFESTSSRMPHMARGELFFQKVLTMDEMIERIENITIDDVNAMAKRIFMTDSVALSIVGQETK